MVVSVRRMTLMLALLLLAFGVRAGAASAATPPRNTSPPTVATASGVQPSPGQTLVASPGTWTGKPAPTYTYEWYECDYSGANCVDTGQSGRTYAVGESDYAHDLEVMVTAQNTAATRTVTSAPVYINASAPTLVDPPTLSGGTQVGDTLTVTTGVWSGYPAPQPSAYTWWDCDPTGANCQPNPDILGSTYTLAPADVGYRIEVTVYVDNGSQASATTDLSAVVAAAAPSGSTGTGSTAGAGSPTGNNPGGSTVNPAVVTAPALVTAPAISGAARVGGRLTASTGSWSGTPTSYRYTWLDCGPAGACRPIKGATGGTYSVRDTDTGYKIAVEVTAANSAGNSKPAWSALTAPVPGPTAAALSRALARLFPRTGTAVLSHGGYTSAFRVPGAGRLTVVWTVTSDGRRLTVASFSARYLRTGTAEVTVRLNTAGKRLLELKRSIVVNARLSFAPLHHALATRERVVTLTA